MLSYLLERAGWTRSEFARRLGKTPTAISYIFSRKRRPKWRESEKWANVLGLTGAERERFIDLMHIAAASSRVWDMFARLDRRRAR